MASTTFVDGSTLIQATWLNDVNVATYTTIPNLSATKAPLISPSFTTPTLGVATATSINGVTINTGVLSGTNTGDQLVFKNIAVSGQSTVVADTTSDTLTLAAGTGIALTTNATTDTVTITSTASSLVLLSTTAITAGATMNVPNVFSSLYDRYLIQIDGAKPLSTEQLIFRVAVAGTIDTSSSYYSAAVASSSVNLQSHFATGTLNSSISITVSNVNSAAGVKGIIPMGVSQSATTTFTPVTGNFAYVGTSVLTGFGFAWSAGSTFVAQGTIRVYGFINS